MKTLVNLITFFENGFLSNNIYNLFLLPTIFWTTSKDTYYFSWWNRSSDDTLVFLRVILSVFSYLLESVLLLNSEELYDSFSGALDGFVAGNLAYIHYLGDLLISVTTSDFFSYTWWFEDRYFSLFVLLRKFYDLCDNVFICLKNFYDHWDNPCF